MKFPPRGGDLGEPRNEVVALYAVTYDMSHHCLAEEKKRIRAVIREIDLGFHGSITTRLNNAPHPNYGSRILRNNWHIRAYSGLGLAVFALAEHVGIDGHTPQERAD